MHDAPAFRTWFSQPAIDSSDVLVDASRRLGILSATFFVWKSLKTLDREGFPA